MEIWKTKETVFKRVKVSGSFPRLAEVVEVAGPSKRLLSAYVDEKGFRQLRDSRLI